ncbi:hypothetical protein SAMN02983003_3083 [Devosia enhydra]|uniref:Response regulatory domain-containing protein n=1 Tax=Devosia enhydra TaxID=665118 RepID=A0A1K2I0W4_9HYPH|nr:response regulator transcription factor [Devosia enhydra]SFZ85911.1 hypothetical protein SAMN02983003_3083 [Devosia enhydra]
MRQSTVAVLLDNPALGSILSATLASAPMLKVRSFEAAVGLAAYARLAPIDILVIDLDDWTEADLVDLKAGIAAGCAVMGLCSGMTSARIRALRAAGIDEVLLKPMSPRYLLERVRARLSRLARDAAIAEIEPAALAPVDWSRFGDNVVPLFG